MPHFTLTTTQLRGCYCPVSRGGGTLRPREVRGNSDRFVWPRVHVPHRPTGAPPPRSFPRQPLQVCHEPLPGGRIRSLARGPALEGLSGLSLLPKATEVGDPQHLLLGTCPIRVSWKQLLKRESGLTSGAWGLSFCSAAYLLGQLRGSSCVCVFVSLWRV